MEKEIIDNDLLREYNEFVEKEALLPIKITQFYMDKIKEEISTIGKCGPLYKSVLPIKEKIEVKTSKETRDYVEEYNHMPVNNVDYIIQKYRDRILVIITDVCFAHCQYCFRTYNLSKFQQSKLKESIINKIDIIKEYLRKQNEINEIILSGGDPISIGYDNLKYVIEQLKGYNIRLHTRSIVYEPSAITKEIIDLLSKNNVRLVFHINHPYEICEKVKNKINEIGNRGIRMYAQFPLIRGINDNSQVLVKLLKKMDNLKIRPLSIFIPDPISYSAAYRISLKRIIDIINEVNWTTPSWINSVRFTMDTTIGKVRIENIISWEENHVIFSREGKQVDYYDLDEGIDVPTPIEKLLWKDDDKNR